MPPPFCLIQLLQLLCASCLILHSINACETDGSVCYDPRDFGAIEGNAVDGCGTHWATNAWAIQAAIDTASSKSSAGCRGCVRLQGGDFLSSDVYLKSNIIFIVDQDTRLITAANKTVEGLVLAVNVSNIDIRGPGTIYGNAEYYIKYYDAVDDRFEPTFPDGSRPRLVYAQASSNISIQNINIQNASDWHIHFVGCQNLVFDNISIYGDWRYPNNDGIDIDSCVNVSISNCNINVADDGLCLKSENAMYGPLRDLVAANLRIRSKSHAIKFGSICNADVSNILFENITIWDSNSGLGIQQRGEGDIHNVTFSNIVMETRYVAPAWWGNGEWLVITAERRHINDTVGAVFDLSFKNISAVSENGGLMSGKYAGLRNVIFNDVHVSIVQGSNYSLTEDKLCAHRSESGDSTILCAGTQDHRPSFSEDYNCGSICRTEAKADGFYFENAHNVSLFHVSVSFGNENFPTVPSYAGRCLAKDIRSTEIYIVDDTLKCQLP